jgi:hypothetical protein
MEGEVEYEALPDHAGLGVHMLAGALVSSIHRHSGCKTDLSSYNFELRPNFGRITSLKAGISEHAIMFPVDSIKVCHPI